MNAGAILSFWMVVTHCGDRRGDCCPRAWRRSSERGARRPCVAGPWAIGRGVVAASSASKPASRHVHAGMSGRIDKAARCLASLRVCTMQRIHNRTVAEFVHVGATATSSALASRTGARGALRMRSQSRLRYRQMTTATTSTTRAIAAPESVKKLCRRSNMFLKRHSLL